MGRGGIWGWIWRGRREGGGVGFRGLGGSDFGRGKGEGRVGFRGGGRREGRFFFFLVDEGWREGGRKGGRVGFREGRGEREGGRVGFRGSIIFLGRGRGGVGFHGGREEEGSDFMEEEEGSDFMEGRSDFGRGVGGFFFLGGGEGRGRIWEERGGWEVRFQWEGREVEEVGGRISGGRLRMNPQTCAFWQWTDHSASNAAAFVCFF